MQLFDFSEPPEVIVIDGSEYSVNYDFRVWIKISEVLSDRSFSDEKRILTALFLCYGKILPKDITKAYKALLEFCKGGITRTNSGNGEIVYSFKFDAPYIYAAFKEQYGIDLCAVKLHWWKFNALFSALNENVMISKIMSYRGLNLADISDKKLKVHYAKLKRAFALPDMRTEEEKEDDWGNAFL